jgi:hypothetical protein
MLLAVALQVVGAALVVSAAFLWFGLAAALCTAGLVLFAAGFAHERSVG